MSTSEKKTNFKVTCSLLSEYLKRRGSFKDLKLDVMPSPQSQEPTQGVQRPPATMSLLPGLDVSTENQTDTIEPDINVPKSMELFPQNTGFGSTDQKKDIKEPQNAQLTIFYSGKVLVFDNFPAEKAQHLMQLAVKESSVVQSATATTTPTTVKADRLPVNNPSTSDSEPKPSQPGSSELPMPIARRASLHRFFAKRKDRINSKAPYQVNDNPSRAGDSSNNNKPEETQSWLGLGQNVSNSSTSSAKR